MQAKQIAWHCCCGLEREPASGAIRPAADPTQCSRASVERQAYRSANTALLSTT